MSISSKIIILKFILSGILQLFGKLFIRYVCSKEWISKRRKLSMNKKKALFKVLTKLNVLESKVVGIALKCTTGKEGLLVLQEYYESLTQQHSELQACIRKLSVAISEGGSTHD